MYCLTLITFTILLQIALINGLDCFTGRVGFGLMYTQCSSNINYCTKATTIDPVYGPVTDKGCDMENFCNAIGSRCLYNSNEEMEICCCASNLCNGSISYFYHWISSTFVIFIFIVLNL